MPVDFPLSDPRSGSLITTGPSTGGNQLRVSVLQGEALLVPDVGLFVAKTTVIFQVTAIPAEGWHARGGLLEKISQPITIDMRREPVSKTIVAGWFNDKPLEPKPPNPRPRSDFSHEYVEAYVHVTDLCIDSDNNDGIGLDRSDAEDAIENPSPGGEQTGKLLIFPKNRDINDNGVPDFADGIDHHYGDGLQPTNTAGSDAAVNFPVVILFFQCFDEAVDKVRFNYSGSDPAAVSREQDEDTGEITYTADSGHLRLWTKDGPAIRKPTSIGVNGGDYVTPGQTYSFADLQAARIAQGHYRFYLEGIAGSVQTADQEISVYAQLKGQSPVKVDAVSVTSAPLEIVPDDSMAGIVGDMVPSVNGGAGEKHFVSPKKTAEIPADYVVFKAQGVSEDLFTRLFEWVPVAGGEAVPGDPLRYRVKRDDALKVEVQISTKGTNHPAAKVNVWIVWVDFTTTVTGSSAIDGLTLGLHSQRYPTAYRAAAGIDWIGTISPSEIITASERPAIERQERESPPGSEVGLDNGVANSENLDASGSGFSGWDVSRQVTTQTYRGPDLIPDASPGYPQTPAFGNDDNDVVDEDSNPYVAGKGAIGQIVSTDEPGEMGL